MSRPVALFGVMLAIAMTSALAWSQRGEAAGGKLVRPPEPEPQRLGRVEGVEGEASRGYLVDVMLLGAEPLWVRDRAVDTVLDRRKAVIARLIEVIDPANAARYNERAQSSATYLLGELRAAEAVPFLARALVNEAGRRYATTYVDRYNAPVFEALAKIGRPAVPAMIEHIETTDDPRLRELSMALVSHVVGSKRHLLELLDKLKARATDPERGRRIQAARDWAEEHYKEPSGEPLY